MGLLLIPSTTDSREMMRSFLLASLLVLAAVVCANGKDKCAGVDAATCCSDPTGNAAKYNPMCSDCTCGDDKDTDDKDTETKDDAKSDEDDTDDKCTGTNDAMCCSDPTGM